MNNKYYAHSLPNSPKNNWHELKDHLQSTANLARCTIPEMDAKTIDFYINQFDNISSPL